MRRQLVAATVALLSLTALLGVAYPLLLAGVGKLAFPGNASGQLLYRAGRPVGSKLIGQDFAGRPAYFQSRPSATSPPYDAAASAASNLGPNNLATEREIAANIAAYIKLNGPYYPGGLTPAKVPVDAAQSSGSGLDPDISPANAAIQAHRVAAVRRLPLARVMGVVARYTSGRGLAFLGGQPGVDVLELNLALDRLAAGSPGGGR